MTEDLLKNKEFQKTLECLMFSIGEKLGIVLRDILKEELEHSIKKQKILENLLINNKIDVKITLPDNE